MLLLFYCNYISRSIYNEVTSIYTCVYVEEVQSQASHLSDPINTIDLMGQLSHKHQQVECLEHFITL